MNEAGKADKNMASSNDENFEGYRAISAQDDQKVCLLGFGFGVSNGHFYKFDDAGMKEAEQISLSLRWGAKCAAGGQIQFVTDSPSLSIKVSLGTRPDMFNMSPLGQCGADCYLLDEKTERFVFFGATKFSTDRSEYVYTFFHHLPKKKRTILIYFPLYAEVKEFLIGIESDAEIIPYTEFRKNGRLVFYGSSILQGGCASRPGMAYTNIVSRRLRMECLNFGFSGNAFGESCIANRLAMIESPAAYVLDYEPNAIEKGTLKSSLPVFIRILRERHKQTPVLIVSGTKQSADYWDEYFCARREEAKAFEIEVIEKARRAGDEKIWFLDFGELFGEEFTEYTVDGIHPTDCGFMLMADSMTEKLKEIVKR
ncbi:MAG: SGNH/GDSL hydrolase family protein [Candidatus Borkfalkiaceae bacterium]|nr:SGNH/GDSL hydrolase family protein [Clostridia bacterium]MDY6223863.1 SGNH/GDSL hydrolase family protein [Christensenellaceae bacterium]